jgi:hypothetical protein
VKVRKWNLALTYEPKTEAVRAGTCRQTIRPVGKGPEKAVGDLISFHGWKGRPYRSPWSWRTSYTPLIEVIDIIVRPDFLMLKGLSFRFPWSDRGIQTIAEKDGIVPPTGEALRDVLMSKNKVPEAGIAAQILRW